MLRRFGLSILAFFCAFLFVLPVADAHAFLVRSNPVQSASLQQAPKEVQLWFSERIQPNYGTLTVDSTGGQQVDAGNTHVDAADGTMLECSLKPNLPDGMYVIHWHVISADGHPVQGIVPFMVGAVAGGQNVVAATTTGYRPGIDMILIRWLRFLSVAAFLGVMLFWKFVVAKELRKPLWNKPLAKWMWTAWAGLTVSLLLSLPLETTIYQQVSWLKALNPRSWVDILLYTSFGTPWLIQIVLLIVLMIVLRFTFAKPERSAGGSWVLVVSGLVFLGAQSLTGHAVAVPQPALSFVMDLLHQTAAALWLGGIAGLVWLRILAKRGVPGVADGWIATVRRFGGFAIGSVIVLAITGLHASREHIPTWYALYHTDYGRLLLVKLGLVLMMILLGAYQFLSTRKRQATDSKVKRGLLKSEVAVGVIVLLMTAVLTNLPTAEQTPGPVDKTALLTDGKTHAELQIQPSMVGINGFDVSLTSGDKPVTNVQQVTLTLSMEDMDMGENEIRMTETKPGVYHAQGMYLTMAGSWTVHVHLLMNDLSVADADYSILVGSQ